MAVTDAPAGGWPVARTGAPDAAPQRPAIRALYAILTLAVAGYSRRKVLDRMIAAQALVHRATLITRNPDDFRDVPGLELLAW